MANKRIGFAAVPAALILILAGLLAQPGHERRVYTTYWDALGGIWTACAGVTGAGVIPGKTYTDAECESLETRYIGRMFAAMGRCVPNASLTFNEIKAWGHFAFNIGTANFCHSTAARLLNERRNAEACKQIPRWRFIGKKDCAIKANRCGGIPKRRAWEFAVCEGRA